MVIHSPDNLTRELAAIGVPNPFAALRLTRNDNFHLFGREYVGWMKISDIVTMPRGRDLYSRCAEGDMDTSLVFDATGEVSQRPAPPADRIYAIVQSPTHSRFWRRLEAAIDLKATDNGFIVEDEFVATYGVPDGAEEIPDTPNSKN